MGQSTIVIVYSGSGNDFIQITKKFKGYAFATLENPEQHKIAVASSSKHELYGRKIILNYRMGMCITSKNHVRR